MQYPAAADSTISSGKRKIEDTDIKQEKIEEIKQESDGKFFKNIFNFHYCTILYVLSYIVQQPPKKKKKKNKEQTNGNASVNDVDVTIKSEQDSMITEGNCQKY